jgi:WD40 repeat protein
MHPDPARRYPSAAELAEELRRHQLGQRVLAHPYSPRELATRWLALRVGVVIAAAAALVLVAAAAILAGVRVARERNRAEATTRTLLVEQGRQQALAGHPARALPYLEEAERRGERSPALAVLLSAVRHSTDGVTRTFPSPGPAMSVAFSPDGRSMAVAHTGGITIQDPSSGRIVRQLAGPTHCFDGLRFTGDGAWLATFGPPGTPDNGIAIWDTRTWIQARVLAPGRDITGVDLSADGHWLVATGADARGAELWEIASGHRRGSFPARIPGDRLRAHFSLDGRQLLTFGHHEGPILRDVASGQVLASVTRAPELLESADVSADGRRLVTGGPWGAQLWALPSGEPVAELVAGQLVGRVAFSPDGARLLAFTTEEAALFASEDGAQVAALGVVPSYWAEFSPDGSRIGVVRAGVLETLSAQTGLVLDSHEELAAPSIVTFTPDGRELVAHHLDLSFRFFDLGASLLAGRISNPPDREPYNAAKRAGLRGFGDGGRTVLATGTDGALTVWDRRGQALPAGRSLTGAELLALSGDGKKALLVMPGEAGRLLVRDTSTGALVCQLAGPFAGRPAVTALAPDGSLVLTAMAGGEVALWDGRTGARTAGLAGVDHPLVAATFSADGSRLYLGEAGAGQGTLWDPRHARRIATLFIDRGGPATFSPDGRFLAVTGDYARLWHADDGTFAYSLLVQARPRLTFSRDSAYLAVLGDGLTIVDVTRGRQLARIEQTGLSAAIFAQSSELLITVGRRITTLMEWRTQRTLVELSGDGVGDAADQSADAVRRGWTGEPPPVVALSPDGQQLALSHRTGDIEVVNLGDAGRGARSFARPWPRPWHLEAGQLIRTERPATATPAPPALNPRPQNLDFEVGPVGAPPPGWVLRGDHRRCTTSADHPRGGQCCALLEADPKTNDDGGLRQVLDARPYRGKMVTARVYLRCPPGTPVLFRMLVTRDGEVNTPPGSLDAGSACTDRWQPVELSRYVDEDAHRLSVGVWLAGPGKVWIDDLDLATDRPRSVAIAPATKTSEPLPPPGRTADQILGDFLRAIGDVEPHRPRTLYVKNRFTLVPEPNETIYGIQELWFGPAGTRSLTAVAMSSSFESVHGGKSGWLDDRFGFRRDTAAVVRAHEGEPTPITEHRRKTRFGVRMVVSPPPGAPRGARLECVALSGGPGDARELDCFDVTDHLLVYAEGVGADGTAYRDFLSDYRTIAGIKVATRNEIHAGNEVHIYDLLEAEGDVKLDERLFRTPDRPDSQGAAH